jgi:molybdenum cofactor biosynthesis enzyme MoaA
VHAVLPSVRRIASRLYGRISLETHRPAFILVVPTRGRPVPAEATRQIVEAARLQAQGFAVMPVRAIAADTEARRLWDLQTLEPLAVSTLRRAHLTVLMNPAFLLADPPALAPLVETAEREGLGWCANRSTSDVHAVALRRRALGTDRLWAALGLLTACVGDVVAADWRGIVSQPMLAPAATVAENSPALAGVDAVRGRRSFDAPPFVNTAFREMLTAPADRGALGGRPERMAEALLAQRRASRVPWIFNTLLDEVEYRLGEPHPLAVPPEVHLSVTGFCNIECRFCAYEHALSRSDFVDVGRVARLDFLDLAQTLRLHSGLGEPTTNPHLPAIIEHVAARFPHVGMNFFTNAVTLGQRRLLDAVVGNVRWLNASLNASGRETWKDLCRADLFDRVCRNLRALHGAKRDQRVLHPLVFGSMVLTRANLEDLPRMPGLCRELGIDRFTAFPYFGLGYHGHDKYGPEMTLAAVRDRYDELYWKTVGEAEAHGVSLEIPPPSAESRPVFGMETRPLHDFARVESNEWKLGRFVPLPESPAAHSHCAFLWRTACIGSTNGAGQAEGETHYLYPCIGPLSNLDLSRRTAFRFPRTEEFTRLWHNPVFTLLRRAQREPGLSPVCDACRATDTRDPRHFPRLERLVADFAREHCALPDPQDGGGGISR